LTGHNKCYVPSSLFLRQFEELHTATALSGVRASCEQRAKQILLVAKATKSKMRSPVYCEQLKTISSGVFKKTGFVPVFSYG